MTYSASLDGATATIAISTINNSTTIKLVDAINLSSQLSAFVNDPSTAPVDNTPNYMAYPTDTGVHITNDKGQIDIPWRWITPIASQLSA